MHELGADGNDGVSAQIFAGVEKFFTTAWRVESWTAHIRSLNQADVCSLQRPMVYVITR